jgi:solute carrier family 39 (zinc transporter), member 1/2/3
VFIILFVSTLACSFPVIASRFPKIRLPARFFFVVHHFGTGVLIATAFVHLLPTAFILLGNSCLSQFWTEDYPAMPGAIALVGIFLVALVEMVFHPSRRMKNVTPESDQEYNSRTKEDTRTTGVSSRDLASQDDDIVITVSSPGGSTTKMEPRNARETGESNKPLTHNLSPLQQQQHKAMLQCVLLEVGILFHSVFIGMTLSVSVSSEFVILLIAIAFHQTFEGLALGSRIASINWAAKSWQPWWMCFAYGCTTPIGQAIGLATHSLYSPSSEVGLLLVGTMNAISAGLLTFASLVELLSEDFLSDESWKVLRGGERVTACVLVLGGAFAMSLVGAWA